MNRVTHQNGENRVLRGGSWINDARNCRAANRNGNPPGNRNENIGFRLSRAHDGGWMAATLTRCVTRLACVPANIPGRRRGRRGGGTAREASPAPFFAWYTP